MVWGKMIGGSHMGRDDWGESHGERATSHATQESGECADAGDMCGRAVSTCVAPSMRALLHHMCRVRNHVQRGLGTNRHKRGQTPEHACARCVLQIEGMYHRMVKGHVPQDGGACTTG